jgi:hypothetical protein
MLYMLEVKDKKGQPINIEKFSPLTYSIGSDSYAYAVVKIVTQKMILVARNMTDLVSAEEIVVIVQDRTGKWKRADGDGSGYWTFGEAVNHLSREF